MKKIFLSHSYLDRNISAKIVEKLLIKLFEISKQDDIFFTGKRETGIESSLNWRNKLKTNLRDCDIFIALITTNFKNSEVCLAEIGAAWILDKKIYPLILPPINYQNFSQIIGEIQADSLLKKEDVHSFINSLQAQLKSLYGIDPKSEVNINKTITDFLKSIKQHINKNSNLFDPILIPESEKQNDLKEEITEDANIKITREEIQSIKEQSKIEWPDDYSMQEYYINEQLQSLSEVKKLQNEVKNHTEKNRIVQRAIIEWPKDYGMQLYKATEEIKAYERLN